MTVVIRKQEKGKNGGVEHMVYSEDGRCFNKRGWAKVIGVAHSTVCKHLKAGLTIDQIERGETPKGGTPARAVEKKARKEIHTAFIRTFPNTEIHGHYPEILGVSR